MQQDIFQIQDRNDRATLMRRYLKRLVNDDKRAKQLFHLFYDRGEISEEQFFDAIARD